MLQYVYNNIKSPSRVGKTMYNKISEKREYNNNIIIVASRFSKTCRLRIL